MATATRNRPARKTMRTMPTTAARLRAGHRLTHWGAYCGPVTVLDVTRTGPRAWQVLVGHDCGLLESAEFAAGETITREV